MEQQITVPSYPVIGPEFCASCAVEFAICRKYFGDLVVKQEDEIIFKVEGASLMSIHDKRTILDAAGNPIVTLRAKILTAHYRWEAFRGKSTDAKDLIFTAKTTSMIQPIRTKLGVFLANNTSEDVCDFKVKGSWLEWSCAVYQGESSTIVAQMSKKFTIGSFLFNMNKFMVTVSPNFDYAFVAALIVILDAVNDQKAVQGKYLRKFIGI